MRLKGKSAIVTGSGRGVGKASAMALAADGANVVINDPGVAREGGRESDRQVADDVVREIEALGGQAVANYDSVTDFDGAARLVNTAIDAFGGVDILINTAGFLREAPFWEMTKEDWDAVVDVHLNGHFNVCRHAVPAMIDNNGGTIINIASRSWLGDTGHVAYSAAKGGVVSLTYSMALELAEKGIRVNAVCPAAATRMMVDPECVEGYRQRMREGKITQQQLDAILNLPGPESVAPTIQYLVCDDARDITDQVFFASGGEIALISKPQQDKRIFNSNGLWRIDEVERLLPGSLLTGLSSAR